MAIPSNPDFSGWASKNDLQCTDGRTIKRDAFKDCDGKTVPLVWNHQHSNPEDVLGHAVLQNRDEGMYAYCYFNDSENGQMAKELVKHGDIRAMSIFANRLKELSKNVIHGNICEVSLVHAPANPGAFIDSVLAHGEDGEETGLIIGYDEPIMLYHAAEKAEEPKEKEKEDDKEETVGDVFNTLTEKQKTVVYALIGQALEDNSENKEEEKEEDNKSMKHNVFDNEQTSNVICHADQQGILSMAKQSSVGSFQEALRIYSEENALQHGDTAPASGFDFDNDADMVDVLFPEYRDVRPGAPELITDDQTWVNVVMQKVHKSPYSRIRTRFNDIRHIDELRAKGYKKGEKKALTGNYGLVRRTTDPQTVYVKNALNRDDIVDIEDFDYVQYQYNIDRMMLNEELATAILIGDGRSDEADDKISADHIRPIWLDNELYTLHSDITIDASMATPNIQGSDEAVYFGENFMWSESLVNAVLYARENYRGTGSPDMFCDPHTVNVMLLARDRNGHRLYKNVSELALALNVRNIYTVEKFANQTRTVTIDSVEHTKKLVCLLVNLADYSLGATRKGQVTHFSQFDIDFNQEKSLIETRVSGALTRVASAIAIEQDVTESEPAPDPEP